MISCINTHDILVPDMPSRPSHSQARDCSLPSWPLLRSRMGSWRGKWDRTGNCSLSLMSPLHRHRLRRPPRSLRRRTVSSSVFERQLIPCHPTCTSVTTYYFHIIRQHMAYSHIRWIPRRWSLIWKRTRAIQCLICIEQMGLERYCPRTNISW